MAQSTELPPPYLDELRALHVKVMFMMVGAYKDVGMDAIWEGVVNAEETHELMKRRDRPALRLLKGIQS